MEKETAQFEGKRDNQDNQDKCLSFLEEEISSRDEKTSNYQLAVQLRSLLMDNDINTEEIIRRIDNYEAKINLSDDAKVQYHVQVELSEYLAILYQLVFTLAQMVPYDDVRQDKLVQLLKDSRVSNNEEQFAEVAEDNWNYCILSEDAVQELGADSPELKERCSDWINFSSFLSRCFKAGLLEYPGGFKYPDFSIQDVLDRKVQSSMLWDALAMGAAQYIIMNAPSLQEKFFKYNAEQGKDRRSSEESWHAWTNRFKEVSNQAVRTPEINAAVKQAYQVMKELDTLASDSIEEKEDPTTDDEVQGDEQGQAERLNEEAR